MTCRGSFSLLVWILDCLVLFACLLCAVWVLCVVVGCLGVRCPFCHLGRESKYSSAMAPLRLIPFILFTGKAANLDPG